jgi:hypothetical protein
MTKRKDPKDYKKMGRPTTYRPEYCEDIVNFFSVDPIIEKDITVTRADGSTIDKTEYEAAPTPYLENWLDKIGTDRATLKYWVAEFPDFSNAYKRAKELQRKFIKEAALKNCHNAAFSIFMMKNVCKWQDKEDENWTDKQELEHSGEVSISVIVEKGNPENIQTSPEAV